MFSLITRRCKAPGVAGLVLFSCMALPVFAQNNPSDTLRMRLPDMEKRFLDSNLLLLAAHYNVDAQKALIEQARKWDNPTLNTDQVVAANGRFLPYGKNPDGSFSGQYYIQLQQLIRTAGKRGKLIDMAGTNARMGELQLQDLLRNLRYQLRSDFYTLQQQVANRNTYLLQMQQLKVLMDGMQTQLAAGNIAQKDYLRIQSLSVSLGQDIAELDRSIAENQAEMRTLLQVKSNVYLIPDETAPQPSAMPPASVPELLETAKQNNPSYLLQQAMGLYQQQNLSYQKALRVPDIMLGPNFDRNSNTMPNYFGLGISIPIPVFNRNQGNIRSAQYSVKQQETLVSHAETELRNQLFESYNKWLLALQQDNTTNKTFYEKYRSMYANVVDSYRRRQIGLLEFLDFFNEYTASQQRLLRQRLNEQLAKEAINYYAGTDIIK
ncbi:TolC family protein [Sediminibacterium soli]|uniref:TolC family protein n=1 Tax=Sediminibacterium soli TaxID=2698829 RepID=UPI00137B1A99|nr:TolC family protein [Sediminibacterium soli]NCI46235.1 TolC family protein [Sediminibacterium soli]